MAKHFFVLLFVVQSWALLLEDKVQIGNFVELNGDATIWLRCEASQICDHNIKAEALAKIVEYKAPKMIVEFEDGTQAWLKATADGFEGMYPTSHSSFPAPMDPALVAAQAVEDSVKAIKREGLLKKIVKCQGLSGPKFEGLGFGCSKDVVNTQLVRKGLKVTKLGDKRLALIAYKMQGQVLNVQLVFNTNNRFSGVEYNFPLENQRKFKKNVVPQLKWMGKLFSQPLGKATETHPLKTRGLYEDQTKPYLTWKKEGFDIQVLFGKTDGMIAASGFIKNVELYLERSGGDVLNLDPKEATLVKDDFEDFKSNSSSQPSKPQKAAVTVPEDEDW